MSDVRSIKLPGDWQHGDIAPHLTQVCDEIETHGVGTAIMETSRTNIAARPFGREQGIGRLVPEARKGLPREYDGFACE
jgi:hypothetical protein